MSVSIRQSDNIFTLTTGAVDDGYFEGNGFSPIEAGDAIVLFIFLSGGTSVNSVTDERGNTYQQISGAKIVASNGGAPSLDVWVAYNVAATEGTAGLGITISTTTESSEGMDVVAFDVAGLTSGATVLVSTKDNSTSSESSFFGASLNGGTSCVFLVSCDVPQTASGLSLSSPFSLISGPNSPDQHQAAASYVGSGSQAPTFSWTGLRGPILTEVAFVISGSGAPTDLSAYNPGDTVDANTLAAIFPASRDSGHVLYSTVYSGTLQGWSGNTGVIVADGDGDAAFPLARTGEYAGVRAHVDDFTFTPSGTGQRVKFLIRRTSAGDKVALLITAAS